MRPRARSSGSRTKREARSWKDRAEHRLPGPSGGSSNGQSGDDVLLYPAGLAFFCTGLGGTLALLMLWLTSLALGDCRLTNAPPSAAE